jgi:hypothetical protein
MVLVMLSEKVKGLLVRSRLLKARGLSSAA